jgi:hypothetical protein
MLIVLTRCFFIPFLQLLAITKEAPVQIENSLKELASATALIEKFSHDEDQLVGDVCNTVADMSPLVTRLSALTGQIRELEKYSRYLSCVAHIEDLRCVRIACPWL